MTYVFMKSDKLRELVANELHRAGVQGPWARTDIANRVMANVTYLHDQPEDVQRAVAARLDDTPLQQAGVERSPEERLQAQIVFLEAKMGREIQMLQQDAQRHGEQIQELRRLVMHKPRRVAMEDLSSGWDG